MNLNSYEERKKIYSIAKEPTIPKHQIGCTHCGNLLNELGIQKLLYPPLDVVVCESCKLEYWRLT